MAKVAVPYEQINDELKRLKIKPTKYGYYIYNTRRVYERIDGKFIPLGYRVFSKKSLINEQDVFDLVFFDTALA